MRKLFAKIYLHFQHYCIKHDRWKERHAMRHVWYECPDCEREASEKRAARLRKAIETCK